MTIFLRLMKELDKREALLSAICASRAGLPDERVFQTDPEDFKIIPGAPFAYWVNASIRSAFLRFPKFESNGRTAKQGLASADDGRFLRVWWEVMPELQGWHSFAKGGSQSKHYADVYLMVNWRRDGAEIKNNLNEKGAVRSNVWMLRDTAANFFLRPGLTWPRRTNGLCFRAIPRGCIFADKGPVAFVENDSEVDLSALSAIVNSKPFEYLVSLQLARTELAQSFEVGLIQQTPVPAIFAEHGSNLAALARRAWSLKRTLDTVIETSHAFLLPATLRARMGDYDPSDIEAELEQIQFEIDSIAFDLYGFSETDRQVALGQTEAATSVVENTADDEIDDVEPEAPPVDALLAWAIGVAFGRFNWRLATGEHAAPAEPEPFDQLPAKSPGMLPDGAEPFHVHAGILVDDQGHPHDLARLVEEVLSRVDVSVPDDVRRWLQRDFFAFHLQRYSKSRRKAPIYWPLATASGSYTLWVYYPSLNNQTLFTAVNDFLDGPNGKLTQVSRECAELRTKGSGRSRDEETQYETLQAFEQELTDLRDTLLKIAPTYQPNHDDGVQITAAPLWQLFRHKPWQKVLKNTWAKLEKDDYNWAHLAMTYWPERVREKCKTDKSLAIAHGLEDLYVEPEAAPKKTHGKKKAGGEA